MLQWLYNHIKIVIISVTTINQSQQMLLAEFIMAEPGEICESDFLCFVEPLITGVPVPQGGYSPIWAI